MNELIAFTVLGLILAGIFAISPLIAAGLALAFIAIAVKG